ncbi:MAG: glycosyltransferase family 9 protein [Rhodospirillaceae bacterium]
MGQRILFVTGTRVGDAILSTGILGWLTDTWPDARFTVACGPLVVPLFERHPRLDRIVVMKKRRHAGHWRDLWTTVRHGRWDLVVDLRRSLLPWTLRAARRASIPRELPGEHRVELLARALDLPEPPSPRLWLSDEDRRRGAEVLDGAAPVLAVAPTSNWTAKTWPAERFAALILRLTAPGGALAGAKTFITGGPDEEALIRPILATVPPDRLIVRMGLDLLATAAAFERCSLFVGNDSGLMHMSAAVGTPTVGLFGPTRDVNYAPWGSRCRAVRTELGVEQLVGAPGFDHRTSGSLMHGLSVETVEEAVRNLLAAHPGAQPAEHPR